MNNEPYIMIAVPNTGMVHYRTASVLTYLASQGRIAIVYSCDRPHDRARNRLVRMFMDRPPLTHLLFIDSDIEPPLDIVQRLLALNAPVASGCYRINDKDGLKWAVLNRDDHGKYLLLKDLPSNEPFDADASGAGCLLIERAVLAGMPWPWFRWVENEDGSQTSEDVFFCKKLNAKGMRVRIDPSLVCIHHKTIGI